MDPNDANATKKSTFCIYLVFKLHIATKLKFEKFWLSNLWKFRCRGISLWFESRHQRCTISPRSRVWPSTCEDTKVTQKSMTILYLLKASEVHRFTKEQRLAVKMMKMIWNTRKIYQLVRVKITKIRWQNKVREWTFSLQRCIKLILYLFKASEVHYFTKEQSWAVKWWKLAKIYEKYQTLKRCAVAWQNKRPEMDTMCSCNFSTTLC